MKRFLGAATGLLMGAVAVQFVATRPVLAQVFPNYILWGKYSSTVNKPIAVDATGKVLISGLSGSPIGGSIASTQIAVGSGTNTIAGSAALTAVSGDVSADAYQTAVTDTGFTYTGDGSSAPVKLLIRSASGNAYALGISNASADTAHYGWAAYVGDTGIYHMNAGLNAEGELAFYPSTNGNTKLNGAWASLGDVVDKTGSAAYGLGRATNPWAGVYANVYRGDTTTGHTALFQVYDNDTGPAYVTWLTAMNGNAPSITISAPAGGTTLTISGLNLTAAVAPAASGTRFLCISTTGVVTSSASACSGT